MVVRRQLVKANELIDAKTMLSNLHLLVLVRYLVAFMDI